MVIFSGIRLTNFKSFVKQKHLLPLVYFLNFRILLKYFKFKLTGLVITDALHFVYAYIPHNYPNVA